MTERLSAVELAELDRLAKAATPGPWQASHWLVDAGPRHDGDGLKIVFSNGNSGSFACSADTTFIAAARQAVPSLLADLAEARKRIADLERAAEKAQ